MVRQRPEGKPATSCSTEFAIRRQSIVGSSRRGPKQIDPMAHRAFLPIFNGTSSRLRARTCALDLSCWGTALLGINSEVVPSAYPLVR
jgi:hypothetical protein